MNSQDVFDQLYKTLGMGAQRIYPNETLVQFIARNFFVLDAGARSTKRIMEIGCGSGANLWFMAKEGLDVYGIDSSETSLRLAQDSLQTKWGVSASLQQGVFWDLPFADCYFDAVCDVVSLQHANLDESARALQEVYRVLKEGAVFFSYRLSDASVMYRCGGGTLIDAATKNDITNEDMPLVHTGPISFWSPVLVQQMYSNVGFNIESIERVGRTYGNGHRYVEYLAISARK